MNGPPSNPSSDQETIEQAFRRLFIARFVERGLKAELGAEAFDAVDFSEIDDMTPEEAADHELSYMEDDEWDGDEDRE